MDILQSVLGSLAANASKIDSDRAESWLFDTNIHLFDALYFDNLTMNFIFSFIFSFDEMENHNDANHIVSVNIDAKSRLWMFWTTLVMKHFYRFRPKCPSEIRRFRKAQASSHRPIFRLFTTQNNPCFSDFEKLKTINVWMNSYWIEMVPIFPFLFLDFWFLNSEDVRFSNVTSLFKTFHYRFEAYRSFNPTELTTIIGHPMMNPGQVDFLRA